MKKSERLRKALDHLWDGVYPQQTKSKFICHAIWETSKRSMLDTEVSALCKIINTYVLPPHTYRGPYKYPTVEDFLLRNGYITDVYSNRVKIQQYRKAWVESLIKEFEAKGD